MSKKSQKIDVSAKHVEKIKKTIHVIKPIHRSDRRSVSRSMYIRLDRRKLHEGGVNADLRDKLSFRDEYELNDLPCTDYERGYMC